MTTQISATRKPKITTGKHGGDDAYSWAVFVDGRPVFTGLSRMQLQAYKKFAAEGYKDAGRAPFRGPIGL